MHPELRERMPQRARLRDLVLVVREDQVEPAAVDLEHGPEVLLRHRRALDVPARPAAAPRRVPPRVLAFLVGLPEREVAWILLQRRLLVLLGRVARRLLVAVAAREPAVVREARDAEVDVASGRVGMARRDELLDHRHDLRDRLGRLRLDVRPAEAEAARVLDVPAARIGGELRAGAWGGRVDLVVDVGDVLGQLHVVARALEPPLQPQRDHERARVADVDALVDGRPAEVHPDRARRRRQLPQSPRGCVVDAH